MTEQQPSHHQHATELHQSTEHHYHSTEHHHHHRKHPQFQNNHAMWKKRRKMLSNVLFFSLCIVAALIMMAVIWMYTAE